MNSHRDLWTLAWIALFAIGLLAATSWVKQTERAQSLYAGAPNSTTELVDTHNSHELNAEEPAPSLEAMDEWHKRRVELGYFTRDEIQAYRGYSIATLQTMADSGDLKALEVLLEKLAGASNLERLSGLLVKGVMHGSTSMLHSLAGIEEFGMLGKKPEDPEYRKALLEALAWYEVGRIRGDRLIQRHAERTLQRSGLKLTAREREAIRAKAQVLYQGLSAQRKQAGLPPFDNEVSPELEVFYSYLNR